MQVTQPKAISYIRFSSSQQSKGTSLKRQRELISSWLSANPTVTLSNLAYEDLGISGYSGHHLENGLGRLLQAIEEGHIQHGDFILIEAMDRLGRLPELEMLTLIQQILKHGVRLVTLQDSTEYSSESIAANGGLLYLLVGKVQQAHNHSKQLSQRLKKAWESKTDDAKKGKGVKRKAPWWISWNPETERYDQVTDGDSALLTDVFTWYMAGLGERRILAKLRELDGDRFGTVDPASIKRWLKNKTAIGYWKDIPNTYPAAIPEHLFYQTQAEIARRADGKSQSPRSGVFLCGLVKCRLCGGNYSLRSHKHSQTAMLCSQANKRKDKCNNSKTIPYQVLDYIRHETFAPYVQQIEVNSNNDEVEQELTTVRGQIAENQKQSQNLVELVALTGVTPDIADKIKSLKTTLSDLQSLEVELLESMQTPAEMGISTSNYYTAVGGELLMDDSTSLNLLLQKHGYKIEVEENWIYCDGRVWEYAKYLRKDDAYLIREYDGGEVIHEFTEQVMREPTPEELAALEHDAVVINYPF